MSADAKASADANGGSGEVNFDANADGSKKEDADWETTADTRPEALTPSVSPTAPQSTPLLGARHDLLVREGTPATCQCLAVAIGQPTSERMVWTGRRPTTNNNSQLVVALGSEGVACSKGGSGASYMGYEVKDGNVIINVEAAVDGRPVTHGAIIPRPQSDGKVFVQPVGKIPYGKGLGGEARCELNLGQ